jgi:group I intron endonuclease
MNLYWIHHKDHSDIFSQGYVGVSNNVEKRWYDHSWKAQNTHLSNAIKKYGWDNLVKKVVLIADDAYCLDIESKLRPTANIGWNITFGGGMPPSALGKKFGAMSEETKAKISAKKTGKRHNPEVEKLVSKNLEKGIATRFKKGEIPALNKVEHTCEHCGKIGKGIAMLRWHMDNCKHKEQSCQA